MDLNRKTKAELLALLKESRSVWASIRESLPDLAELDPFDRNRAVLALSLAEQLDRMNDPDKKWAQPPAPAPVAKELRAVLAELEAVLTDDDESSAFFGLSPSMGNETD